MTESQDIYLLPSRAEEARRVAQELATRNVTIAYYALPDMGLDHFRREIEKALLNSEEKVDVVSVTVQTSLSHTMNELKWGLQRVNVSVESICPVSEVRSDENEVVYKVIHDIQQSLKKLPEDRKIVIIWKDFDRMVGSVDGFDSDLFEFPKDFHLSMLVLSPGLTNLKLNPTPKWRAAFRCGPPLPQICKCESL